MRNLPLVSFRNKHIYSSLTASFFAVFPFNKITRFSSHSTFYCVAIFFFCLSWSCTPVKNSTYFENLKKDTTLRNLVSRDLEPKIQKGDVLSINVSTLSPDMAFYNSPTQGTSGSSAQGSSTPNGYLVDKEGNIDFVKLGSVHADGLTKKELRAVIEKALVPFLKDVIVNIAFLNRHVTMLGGLTSQVLSMPGDNMTILDALAASGDIGAKGKIDNVLIIREKDEDKVFKRLNLKDNSIFYSPYFFLQPNDIIYVEPTVMKTTVTATQIISYATSIVSLLVLILTRL